MLFSPISSKTYYRKTFSLWTYTADEFISLLVDVIDTVLVDTEVGVEGPVFLLQALYSSQGVSVVIAGENILLLVDPSLLLVSTGQKLLVSQRFVQLTTSAKMMNESTLAGQRSH